ncbi:MAG: TIGR03557 family F420-dependent LLM class oxidoreductase [Methanomicrobiales archaeon]|nr:TIGR03557 family F420-dependent LLM class oxidoreductase [Methanomicrobiales archaeon]
MVEIGYYLDCEEHGPPDLIRNARMAEEGGFSHATIADHHPWTSAGGQSPFAGSGLGGFSQAISRMRIVTGVTCPTVRYHPALGAQMAATMGVMMPGRFTLAAGSGEYLNEHIYGDKWPPAPVRIETLAEAVGLIRTLWQGGMQDYHGWYYTVENAQIFTLPEESLPIAIASEGRSRRISAGGSETVWWTPPSTRR